MRNFWITRKKWGKFVDGDDLRSLIENIMGPYLKRAGLAIVSIEMVTTPVRTGHLRRGWAIGEPEWDGSKYKVRVGNAVIYARRVNATSRANSGYVERGLEAGRDQALDILKQGVEALRAQLWKVTG